MSEPITVIINAHAGGKYDAAWGEALTEQFRQAGCRADVVLASNGEAMIVAARTALNAGVTKIVAGGGDGTMNAIASVIIGSKATMGVLPLGTLNHFARDIGIPEDVGAAIQTILHGDVLQVDTGEVNGKIFLNNSGLGIYPNIVRDREHQQRRLGRGKWLAFLTATVTALRRYPFMTVRIMVDGIEHRRHTPFIFIGNNDYSMTGFTVGQRSTLTDGALSLYMTHGTSRLGLVRLALYCLFGKLKQARDFDALNVKQLSIETRHRRLPVSTDGEVCWMNAPLLYSIRPASLRVMVPA
jgi:YegS/Rv2252/BmrU family lipid kinase